MPTVGTILRGARLQAGLALEDIATRTRIPVRNLRAIEEDDLSQVTSAFFYKSFVRQFCEQVEVSYGRISDQVLEACHFYPEPFSEKDLQAVLQRTLVKPRRRRLDFRLPLASAALILVLVGCSGLYSIWRQGGKLEIAGTGVANLVAGAEAVLPSQHEANAPSSGQKSGSNPVAPASTKSEVESSFRVEVSALEPSWLSISADGHETFSGILDTAERKIVEGHETGRVRTGNAGGLRVIFNGKPVDVGPRGQVRVVVFTKNNYEVLDPGPVHSASIRPAHLPLQRAALTLTDGLTPLTPIFR